MVMRSIQKILLIAAVLLGGIVQAQNRYELSVKEAVEMAYKNVIELKNAQVDYRIQEAQNKQIFGQALPQITGTAGTQYYMKLPQVLFPQSDEGIYEVLRRESLLPANAKAPDPRFVPFSFQQPWNLNVGASLQQLLFQPDVFVGLMARKTALDLSNAVIEQTKEAVKDSAYKRYYAILIAEKQLHFLNESVKRLEKLYHDDSIMFKNGFAERLDLDRVQVQLNNLKTTQSVVENAVLLSYAGLKFAIGASQKDIVVLKDSLTTASIKEDILDNSFKYEDRAEIRTLELAKSMRELDVKRNKLGYLPTVALAANYNITGMGKKFFTSDQTFWLKSSFVGLNVNVPIFDGYQRKYKTLQAQLNVEKAENNIANVKQVIDLQQVITKESLKNALLNLDIQERNLELAQKVYNTTKLKFEQGLGSSFEVLQSDTDYQTAQSNYFNALYNATVAKISYQSALGKLQ
jgi:outer membrane protein TolC